MHSRTTEFYNLPQFDSTDKPTWLGDINGAFLAIDAALHTSGSDSADALEAAQRAINSLNSALTRATRALELSESAATDAGEAKTAAANALTVANNTATLAQALNAKIDTSAIYKVWSNPNPRAAWNGDTLTIDKPAGITGSYDVVLLFDDGSLHMLRTDGYDVEARMVDINRTTGAISTYSRPCRRTDVSGGVSVGIFQCNQITPSGSGVDVVVDNEWMIPLAVFLAPWVDARE